MKASTVLLVVVVVGVGYVAFRAAQNAGGLGALTGAAGGSSLASTAADKPSDRDRRLQRAGTVIGSIGTATQSILGAFVDNPSST